MQKFKTKCGLLVAFLIVIIGQSTFGQTKESKVRSTNFPVFPDFQNNKIAGAPLLCKPQLITGTKQEIRVEKHGLSYPAFYDWNGDGKMDLLVGEFETGDTVSNIKVFLNQGSRNKPKYSGEFFYANDVNGHRIANHQWCCIGIHPRFVDINGDKKLDILSGQYNPGLISLWRGTSKGFLSREFIPQEGYEKGRKLNPFDQDLLNPENNLYWNYSAADFADFDGDGLLDLFIGGMGNFRVAINEGSKEHPKFGLRKFLLGIDGYPVSTGYVENDEIEKSKAKFSMPDFTGLEKAFVKPIDWDGDGVLDLLVTHAYTDPKAKDPLLFFRGIQTDKGLRFEKGVPLIQSNEFKKIFPGCQPNISITDFNNDGVLDIVFGVSLPTVNGFEIDSLVSWNYLHDLEVESPGKDAGRAIEYEKGGMDGLLKKIQDPNYKRYYLGKLEDSKYLTLRHRGYVYVMLGKKNPVRAVARKQVVASSEIEVKNRKTLKSEIDQGPVSYAINSPGAIKVGQDYSIEVSLNIEEGWYAYVKNETNMGLGFIPTQIKITLPAGFVSVDTLQSPVPSMKGGYEVYKGKQLRFVQKFKISDIKHLKNGDSYPIKINLIYQTCNEELCLPPVEEEIVATVKFIF